MLLWIRGVGVGLAIAAAAWGQAPVNVIYLEPAVEVSTNRAEITEAALSYRRVTDVSRYQSWTKNPYAERAFRLYRIAHDIARPGKGTPDYYVALVKGGNHAAVGFRLQENGKMVDHPGQPYILL